MPSRNLRVVPMSSSSNIAHSEAKAVFSLASIFAIRMLGLFMILPVFSVYAGHLQGSTPSLIGIALGVYGLSQGLLQMPLGMLSDRIGRKPVIFMGLVMFAIGSVVAGFSHSIYGVILGRTLQGAGAIGSTTMALIADVTQEKNRTKAMAAVGMTIGLSFSLAMVLGPVLNHWIAVNGIFFLTAILAVLAIIILFTLVPTPVTAATSSKNQNHKDVEAVPALFRSVISNRQLLRLDMGIFILHAILTATFVVLPLTLLHINNIPMSKQWMIYLPIVVGGFFTMVPFIIIAEKKQKMKPVFLGGICATLLGQLGMAEFNSQLPLLILSLLVFFTGFNLLEACLPSLVSKLAPASSKGTAMGIYSSSQFLGIFFGGSLGGYLYGQHHVGGVYIFCALLAGIWLMFASSMQQPQQYQLSSVNS